MYFAIFLAAYLGIGYLLHAVIFPEQKPDISTYFKPGDIFYSKTEKIKQSQKTITFTCYLMCYHLSTVRCSKSQSASYLKIETNAKR